MNYHNLALKLFTFGFFLLILTVGLLGFLGWTETGSRMVLDTGDYILSGDIRYQSIDGVILGKFTLQKFNYSSQFLNVSVDSINYQISPTDLLWGILKFKFVNVHTVDFKSKFNSNSPDDIVLPNLFFPIHIVLEELSVESISLSFPNYGSDRFRIRNITGSIHSGQTSTRINRLSIDGETFTVFLKGWIEPHNTYNHRLETYLNYHSERFHKTVKSRGMIQGDLKQIKVAHKVTEPTEIKFKSKIKDIMDDINWTAQIEFSEMGTDELVNSSQGMILSGKLKMNGNFKKTIIQGNIRGKNTKLGPLRLEFEGNYQEKNLMLKRSNFSFQQIDRSGTIHGALNPFRQRIDKIGGWDNQPSVAGGSKSKYGGEFVLSGTPENYEIHTDGQFYFSQYPNTNFDLHLIGNWNNVVIKSLQISNHLMDLESKGTVGMADTIDWNFEVRANQNKLPSPYFNIDGSGILRARTVGTYNNEQGLEGNFQTESLRGTIENDTFDGGIDLKMKDNQFRVNQFRIDSKDLSFDLEGKIGNNYDVKGMLNISDFEKFVPDHRGDIRSKFFLQGNYQEPEFQIQGQVNDYAFRKQYSVESAEFTGYHRIGSSQSSDFQVKLNNLKLKNWHFQDASFNLVGRYDDHRLNGFLDSKNHDLTLNVAGSYSDTSWKGKIRNVTVESGRFGKWDLTKAGRIRISMNSIRFPKHCIKGYRGKICLSTESIRNQWKGTLQVPRLSSSLMNRYLGRYGKIQGPIKGSMEGKFNSIRDFNFRGNIAMDSGELTVLTKNKNQSKSIENLAVQFQADQNQIQVDPELQFDDMNHISANMTVFDPISDTDFLRKQFTGKLTGSFRDLILLRLLSERVEWEQGKFNFDIRSEGSFQYPKLANLSMEFQSSGVKLPSLGIQLQNLEIKALKKDTQRISIAGNTYSGDGKVRFEGETLLSDKNQRNGNFTIKGEDFTLVNNHQAKVVINPDLDVSFEDRMISLSGNIGLPEAKFTPSESIQSNRVTLSDDVEYVDTNPTNFPVPSEESLFNFSYKSNVLIQLGPNVHLSMDDFTDRLSGEIRIIDNNGEKTLGDGILKIEEGVYNAYNQKLSISGGKLIYRKSPLGNPILNLEATKEFEDGVVGIQVKGTVDKPDLRLFSRPPMSEDDILSYLIFDVPANKTGKSQNEILSQVTSTMGLTGGDLIVSNLGQALGLDKVNLRSDRSFEETALEVGKFLTPKLYIGYGINLFGTENTIKFRYKLNDNWSIRAESGQASGADLMYEIDR